MPHATLKVRQDVFERLRHCRVSGESFSDVVNRLLNNQPATTVGEWINSLAPLEGRALFNRRDRERLTKDQRNPRTSCARRKLDNFESVDGLKRAKSSL